MDETYVKTLNYEFSSGSLVITISPNIICFLEGSKVLVDNVGYKNIEHIQKGEFINKNKVLGIISNPINGKIIKIQKMHMD